MWFLDCEIFLTVKRIGKESGAKSIGLILYIYPLKMVFWKYHITRMWGLMGWVEARFVWGSLL